MSVNCLVILPPNVRVKDVGKVIGKLLGLPTTWGQSNGARWADVPGVTIGYHPGIPMVTIEALASAFHAYYHFEYDGGNRLLTMSKSQRHIAIARGLVDFFGGQVVEDDCAAVSRSYRVPMGNPDSVNMPEDGPEWDIFQRRIDAVQPIAL